jgi:hypothetical protein
MICRIARPEKQKKLDALVEYLASLSAASLMFAVLFE